ncbi:MAG: hypothetical protein OTJ44_07325 [Planctomycetota bacterium]|nr:hypothetical protein [Planctomycetota bacterium]
MKLVRRPMGFSIRDLDRRGVQIVTQLQNAGYEAYLVGGCVRDILLGYRPKDFDIATSARPNQVRRIFRRSRVIGRRFKIVHVYSGREIYEVSTFRAPPRDGKGKTKTLVADNDYGTAEQDAWRRDFTLNALYLDPKKKEILDWVGGLEAIEARQLISIGDPRVRFQEDPVRVLRLIKFMRRMGLTGGAEEIQAAKECASLLQKAPDARLLEEIFRLMRTGDMEGVWDDLHLLNLLPVLLPEFRSWLHAEGNVARMGQYFAPMDAAIQEGWTPSYAFLLSILFSPRVQDDPRPQELVRRFQQRARLPRGEVDQAIRILQIQPQLLRPIKDIDSQRRPPRFLGEDWFPEALECLRCSLVARGEELTSYDHWHERRLSLHPRRR